MEDQPNIRIRVPKATLEGLSFCETTAGGLSEWAAALPMANTANAAEQVSSGVKEVAALATTAAARLELLEVLRPSVHYLSTRLDRAAMSQSQHTEAIGTVAQNLQTDLCTGYKAVVRDALRELNSSRAVLKDVLPKAIHRAISDLSRQHLRTLQLYVSPPKLTWLELNQLYHLAEKLDLCGYQTKDGENHHDLALSITDTYLRLALLSCCKPNQLRHRNLSRIFNVLEHWASRVMIVPKGEPALFTVDLAADSGPVYTALKRKMREPRGIRTDILVYEIDAYLKDIDSSIPIPDFMDAGLMQQLTNAWGHMSKRSFRRLPADGSLMVCVGLRASHYFLSGGVQFSEQVSNTDTILRREINPFMDQQGATKRGPSDDVWDDAFDLRVRIPINPNIADPDRILLKLAQKKPVGEASSEPSAAAGEEVPPNGMQCFETAAVDTSPGGYCLRWHSQMPENLQSGELLIIRESSDPRWCVAVVRWIRQNQEDTTCGIELLAPRAIPVAVRVIQKRGGPTDYARALLLPELKPIGQAATLITPRVPFASDHKIHVHRQGVQTTAQLQEVVASTDSFNQFTFRMLDGYLENAQIDLNIQSLSALIGDPEPDTK